MRRCMKWLPALAGLAVLLAFASFLPARAEAWGGCGCAGGYYGPGAAYYGGYGAYYGGCYGAPAVYRAPVAIPRSLYRGARYYGYSPYRYGVYSPYSYGGYYAARPYFYGW